MIRLILVQDLAEKLTQFDLLFIEFKWIW